MKSRLHLDRARVRESVEEAMVEHNRDVVRRIMKCWCWVLNEQDHMGKQRLEQRMRRIAELVKACEEDEEYAYHLDKRMKQIGMDFEKEKYPSIITEKDVTGTFR